MPALLEVGDSPSECFITIKEGKFHQVKRMFERVGKTVTYLKRVSIGGYALPCDLALGGIIEIDKDTLANLIYSEV